MPLLVLHDTSEFIYKRDPFNMVGVTNKIQYTGGALHAVGGIFMHSSLAVTNEDLPIGLSAAKFRTRGGYDG